MKKLIVLFGVLLIAGITPIRAQLYVDHSPKLKFGVTAGLNITQTTTQRSDLKRYFDEAKAGFLFGPTLTFIAPAWGVGADLSVFYDQRTAQRSTGFRPVKSRTIQLPLNFRYQFNVMEVVYPFIFAGPQLSYYVGYKEQWFAEGVGKTTGDPLIRKWEANDINVSLNFGIGLLAMDHAQARICYNLPISNTANIRQQDLVTGNVTSLGGCKMGSCQILLTYYF